MKKIVSGIVLIAALLYLFRGKIEDVFSTTSFPEPKTVAFEKQRPLYSYDWKLIERSGKSMSFIEYKDRNVIVNYWSPNSKESVEELKIWAKLYEDYKNELFFIFVTKDKQLDVNVFLDNSDYTFPVFYSGTTPLGTMTFDAVPETYLITNNGRVVVENKGPANWNSDEFRKLLDDLIKHNK